MREGKLVFSAIQFLMIAALFAVGAAFFCLHYLPGAREELGNWIIEQERSFFLLGWIVCAAAAFLTICFWAMQRSSYVRIEMNNLSVHEEVIRKTIHQFWKEEFPRKKVPSEVYLAHQKIEVIIEDEEQNLRQVEEKLGKLLADRLGYDQKFYLTLTKY